MKELEPVLGHYQRYSVKLTMHLWDQSKPYLLIIKNFSTVEHVPIMPIVREIVYEYTEW